jgi:hypothetical protein
MTSNANSALAVIDEMSTCILTHRADSVFPFPISDSERFGIVSVKLLETEIVDVPIAILFTVDCSASMADNCKDDKTKIQHAIHTLSKILMELASVSQTDIYVSVISFDDIIHTIFDFVKITKNNVTTLIEKIQEIKPDKSTNIEIALKTAATNMELYLSQNPTHRVYHIQLTDGVATAGESNSLKLLECVSNRYTNIFVGFGTQHDAELLEVLSSNRTGDYRFVDQIENSGFVYGEILHSILYCAIENPRIEIKGGIIYDWTTNSWETKIELPNLASGMKKEYHIKYADSQRNDVLVKIYGKAVTNSITSEELLYEIDIMPEFIDHEFGYIIDPTDLTRYAYRQIIQELIFEIKSLTYFNLTKERIPRVVKKEIYTTCKYKLKRMMDELNAYMSKNKLESDLFMRLLYDDLDTCYKSLGLTNERMFICARQRSQGNQNTYTPRQTEEVNNVQNLLSIPKLSRTKTNCFTFDSQSILHVPVPLHVKSDLSEFIRGVNDHDNVSSSVPHLSRNIQFLNQQYPILNSIESETNYETNPYSTPKMLNLMRNISSQK